MRWNSTMYNPCSRVNKRLMIHNHKRARWYISIQNLKILAIWTRSPSNILLVYMIICDVILNFSHLKPNKFFFQYHGPTHDSDSFIANRLRTLIPLKREYAGTHEQLQTNALGRQRRRHHISTKNLKTLSI